MRVANAVKLFPAPELKVKDEAGKVAVVLSHGFSTSVAGTLKVTVSGTVSAAAGKQGENNSHKYNEFRKLRVEAKCYWN